MGLRTRIHDEDVDLIVGTADATYWRGKFVHLIKGEKPQMVVQYGHMKVTGLPVVLLAYGSREVNDIMKGAPFSTRGKWRYVEDVRIIAWNNVTMEQRTTVCSRFTGAQQKLFNQQIHHQPQIKEEEEDMPKQPKLYTWIPEGSGILEAKFGHKIGETSDGKWVMEAKGAGGVDCVDKAVVEAVTPFTVMTAMGQHYRCPKKWAEEGLIKEGSIILNLASDGPDLIQVKKLDTKHEGEDLPTLRGLVLQGTILTPEEE